MRVFKIFLIVAFLSSHIASAYAEIMFDKSAYQPVTVKPTMRSPQEIIADFQASVDRIQQEQQGLYGQIETKNRENTLLLRKINDLSVKLLQLEYSISKRSTQDNSAELAKLSDEKEILLKKYNETLSQKLALEKEVKNLVGAQQSVEDKVQAGLAKLREALSLSEEKIAEQKGIIDVLVKEKETLEQNQRQALEDRSALQSKIKSLEVQIQETKNAASESASIRQNPLQQRVRELSDRVDQMREDLKIKDQAIVAAKKSEAVSLSGLKKAEKDKGTLEEKVRKLTSTYTAAQEGRAAKIKSLEETIVQKQKQIENLSGQQPKKVQTVDSDRKKLVDEIARLKENAKREESLYEQKLEKAKSPFLLQIEALQRTLDEKNSTLQKKDQELLQVKAKSDVLTKELFTARQEKNDLSRSVKSLEKRVAAGAQKDRDPDDSLQKQIVSLKEDIARRDEELKEKSLKYDALEAEKKELVSAIEKSKIEKAFLQEEMGSYSKKSEEAPSGATPGIEEVKKDYEQKMSFLSAEIRALEDRVKDKDKEIAQRMSVAQTQKENLQTELQSLKDELSKAKATGASEAATVQPEEENQGETALKNELSQRGKEISTLKEKQEKLEKELKKATDGRAKFEDEIAALRSKLDAQGAVSSEKIRAVQAPLEESIAKLNEQLADQTELLDDKEQMVADLNLQNKAWETNLKKLTQERDDLKKKVLDLERSLEKSKAAADRTAKKDSAKDQNKENVWLQDLKKAQDSLREKNAQIDDLKSQNGSLTQKLSDAQMEKEQAQASLTKLRKQFDELQLTVQKSSSAQPNAQEALITTLNKKIADLNAQVGRLTEEKTKTDESLRKLEDEKTASAKNTGASVSEIEAQHKKEVEDLKKATADSEEALKNQEALVSTLNGKIAGLNKEVERLTQEKGQVEDSLQKLTEQKSEFEKTSQQIAADVDSRRKNEMENLKKSSTDSKEALKVQEELVKTLNTKIVDLTRQVADLTDEGVQLRSSLNGAKDERARLEKELAKLKKESAQKASPKTSVSSPDLSSSMGALTKERDEIRAKLEEVLNERENLKDELQKTKEDLRKSSVKNTEQKYQAELSSLKDTKNMLESQLAQSAARIADQDKAIKELNAKIDDAQKTKGGASENQWQQKIDAISADLKKSQERSAGFERSTEELKKENERLTASQKELLSKLSGFDKEKTGYEDKIKSLTQQITAIQTSQSSEIVTVKSEAAQKAADLAKKLADAVGETRSKEDLIAQMSAREKSLEGQLNEALLAKSRAESSVKQYQTETETLRKDLTAEKDRTKNELSRVGTDRDDQLMRINELQNALKDAQKQGQAALDETKQSLSKQIEELKAEVQTKDGQLLAAGTRTKELETTKDDLIQQLATAQLKQKDLQSKFDEWKSAISEKENQNRGAAATAEKELNDKLAAVNAQLESSKRDSENLTKQKEEIAQKLKNSEEKIAKLEEKAGNNSKALAAQKQMLTDEFTGKQKTLEGQIKELTSKLEESQRLSTDLAKAKDNLGRELKTREDEIAQLKLAASEKDKVFEAAQTKASSETTVVKKAADEQVQKLTQQLEDLRGRIDELERAKEGLASDLKDRETKIAQLEPQIAEKQKALDEIKERSSIDLSSAQKISEQKIQELSAQLKDAKDSTAQLSKSKEGLEAALIEAKTKVAQLTKDLSEQTGALQGKLAEQEKSAKASVDEIRTSLTKEINGLNQKIKENAAQLESLSIQNKELAKAKDDLTQQLASAQAREKENQIKTAGVQEAMINKGAQDRQALITLEKDLNAKIADITSQLTSSQGQVAQLSKAKETLEKDLKAKEEKISKLEVESIEKQNALTLAQSKSKEEIAASQKAAQKEIDGLNAKIKDHERIMLDLAKSKEILEESLKAKEAQIAEAQKQIAEKDSSLAQSKAQAADQVSAAKQGMKSQIDELTAQKKTLSDQITKLTDDLKTARASVDELSKSKTVLEKSLSERDQKISGLQAQISENDKNETALKAQASEQLAAVENKLNAQIKTLNDQLKETQGTVGALTKSKEGLEVALKESQSKLALANAEAAKKEEALKSLQADIPSQIAKAKEPLGDKIDILVKSLGDVQAEVKTKDGTIDGLKTKVSGLEKSLNETTAAKADLAKESAETKSALEKMRKDMAAEIQKANKPLVEKAQVLQMESDEKTKKINALTAEKDKLTEQLNQITADERKLQQDLTLMKQDLDGQKRALAEKEASVKAPLLAQIAELQKTIDDNERLIDQKAEAFKKVNEELATVLKGLAVIREDRDKMSATVKPLQELIKGIPQEVALAKAPLEQENSRLKTELEKVQGMLDVRVRGLEADLSQKSSEYERVEADRKALEKEIARVSKTNDELSQDMENLQLKLSKKFQEDCGVALEEIQKPWKDKIDQLKSQLDGKDKEIESFKNENLRLNQELGTSDSASTTK